MDRSAPEHRVEISWAACPRWATLESSDLVDAVEQLGGHWALVLIDVQGSGRGGRRLASTLMQMTREYLASGMTAATAVLAVHEHLCALRQGKVGASIHVCEVDAAASRVHVSGLGTLCIGVRGEDGWDVRALDAPPAGFEQPVTVDSCQSRFDPGARIVLANDGIAHRPEDLAELLARQTGEAAVDVGARQILDRSIARDSGRPRSDMAIAMVAHTVSEMSTRVLDARISIPVKRHGSDL